MFLIRIELLMSNITSLHLGCHCFLRRFYFLDTIPKTIKILESKILLRVRDWMKNDDNIM